MDALSRAVCTAFLSALSAKMPEFGLSQIASPTPPTAFTTVNCGFCWYCSTSGIAKPFVTMSKRPESS